MVVLPIVSIASPSSGFRYQDYFISDGWSCCAIILYTNWSLDLYEDAPPLHHSGCSSQTTNIYVQIEVYINIRNCELHPQYIATDFLQTSRASFCMYFSCMFQITGYYQYKAHKLFFSFFIQPYLLQFPFFKVQLGSLCKDYHGHFVVVKFI